jgi:MFS family permease
MFILFLLLMFPLATTELGVDSWITSFMGAEMSALGLNSGWVLIYTSTIMLVLRFFAGRIAHHLSPLGLLASCAGIAAVGLFALSATHGAAILLAATLYGIGKTFFWPTTLAVVADQCPRGGALTINLVAGVGMLAVGIVGTPFMGAMQDRAVDQNLAVEAPALHSQVMQPRSSIFGNYRGLDAGLVAALRPADQQQVERTVERSQKDALRTIAFLPLLMMVAYVALLVYFRATGGYRPATLREEAQPALGDRPLVPR